jgi:hypothetical protein
MLRNSGGSVFGLLLAFTILASSAIGAEPKAKRAQSLEPKISSIYPGGGQRGTAFDAEVRGANMAGARCVLFDGSGVEAKILGGGEEADKELLRLQITVGADATSGRHSFRIVTARGVSNRSFLSVSAEPVLQEAEVNGQLRQFPVIINGRIASPGESDSYWIEASAGETLTFEATSFSDEFDPSVVLSEPSGSWFDSHRLNPIASNDEPLFFPGLSTNARLVARFPKSGKYCVQVQGFSGQGSADFVYQLRIVRGVTEAPSLHPEIAAAWEERQFTRSLSNDRLDELARRGGTAPNHTAVETFRAVPESAQQIPVMTAPGVVEGRIEKPGEAHLIRLKVDKRQDLAIEVETPAATLPRFNPVVRLMEPGGREIATDVYTKLNNNGLYMMKMIEAKTTVSLNAPGEYTIQVRDITTGEAGPDFRYRVLVRPQIPHVGKIEVAEDHVNLEAGSSLPLNVVIDREEGFSGYITVGVEGLPAGVTAVAALENPAEKPPLPNGGKLERYVAKEQRTSVMLVAAADAPLSDMPAIVRVVVRVVSAGQMQEPIAVKEIPLMIVARSKA